MTSLPPTRTWAVVGGGFLGMTLARGLRAAGHEVELIESRSSLGGLADAWSIGDYTWDRHYHVLLESDLRVLALVRDLGLEDQVRWEKTRTGFFTDGRLHSMSNAVEFLTFPPLDLLSKFRLGLTILYCSRIRDGRRLESTPVSDFLTKWSGRRAFERIWKPLLQAKLGDGYVHASASFIWAIIRRMYSARRQGAKTERLGYLAGGYGPILEELAAALDRDGIEVKLGSQVETVLSADNGTKTLKFSDGTAKNFDRVVLTQAAPLVARMCPELAEDEALKLNALRYQGVICESVLLNRALSDFYVTNITDTWVPFTGVIEMTALVPKEHFGGNSLVYLPRYLQPDDSDFDLSDEELRESTVAALQRMYPDFDETQIVAHRVSRARYVLAVSTLNYSLNMPPVATGVPGLFAVGSAHINNGTLNIDETLQLALRTLPELLDEPVRKQAEEELERDR